MAGYLYILQQQRLIDNNGLASGGSMYFYYTGTSVFAPIYADQGLTTPLTNPVVVNAAASIPSIFLDPTVTYRCRIVYPDGFVDDSDPLDELAADLQAAGGADLIGYQAPGSPVVQTVGAALNYNLNLLSYMSSVQLMQSMLCKQQTDPAPDMTSVVQALISSAAGRTLKLQIPTIVDISSTLSVPVGTNVNWDGVNSAYEFVAGGPYYTGGGLRWVGANNGVVLLLDTTNGSTVNNLLFETKSSDIGTISITGVVGIRVVNKGASHFLNRGYCNFSKLGIGVHFYDEGLSPTSDFNMDAQIGIHNSYRSCVEGIRVEQTNVYEAMEYRPSFFGNSNYTKNHVNIVKGHYAVDTPFVGGLKNAASPGGRNGCAFLVTAGYITVTNIHSELKDGVLFDWVAPIETNDTCLLTFQSDSTETASLPFAWEIRNQTNNALNIIGTIANPVEQLAGTTGQINIFGAKNPLATAASQPNAVSMNGVRNSRPGSFGSLPNGSSGGGQASLDGYNPRLVLFDQTGNSFGSVSFLNNVVRVGGGLYAGMGIDLVNKWLDLNNPDLAVKCLVRTLATINTIYPTPPDGLCNIYCTDLTLTYTTANFGATAVGGGANKGFIGRVNGAWVIC